MKHFDERAFTLIELLVVISIIALLIAILLPSLANARKASRKAICSSNFRQLIILQNVYEQENGEFSLAYVRPGTPPSGFNTLLEPPAKWWHKYWMYYLVKNQPNYQLPTTEYGVFKELSKSIFHCPDNSQYVVKSPAPSLATTDTSYITYAMNWHLGAEMKHANSTDWRDGAGYISDRILLPSATLMFIDFLGHPVLPERYPYFDRSIGEARVMYPHLQSANVAFVDGHVASLGDKAGRAAATVPYSTNVVSESPKIIVQRPARVIQ
jgi:prepilin-type N-terminal cleavage/methylation domain-containing protein/prepilin-type processing-associated H-X9-DG protein